MLQTYNNDVNFLQSKDIFQLSAFGCNRLKKYGLKTELKKLRQKGCLYCCEQIPCSFCISQHMWPSMKAAMSPYYYTSCLYQYGFLFSSGGYVWWTEPISMLIIKIMANLGHPCRSFTNELYFVYFILTLRNPTRSFNQWNWVEQGILAFR